METAVRIFMDIPSHRYRRRTHPNGLARPKQMRDNQIRKSPATANASTFSKPPNSQLSARRKSFATKPRRALQNRVCYTDPASVLGVGALAKAAHSNWDSAR
jgi:hypothetical protein